MAREIERVPSRHAGAGMDRLDRLCVKRNLRWGLARGEEEGELAIIVWSGQGHPTRDTIQALDVVQKGIDVIAGGITDAFENG